MEKQWHSFTAFSMEIAKEAGKILLEFYGKLSAKNISNKGINDFVTNADQSSEKYIVSQIEQKFPDHNIYAEEFTNKNVNGDYTWFIDPLDGTTNFVHNHPFFAVSLGLRYQNKIVSGVVYVPLLNEMFSATRNQGAFLNDQKIAVSSRSTLQESLIATGFPYKKAEITENNVANFNRVLPIVNDIRRCGAAAIDLCYVACGRYEGFWELWLQSHDVAAASLIVEEAGGAVTDFQGTSDYIFSHNVVATNTLIHQELRKLLSFAKKEG